MDRMIKVIDTDGRSGLEARRYYPIARMAASHGPI